jgi:hypothetical protein
MVCPRPLSGTYIRPCHTIRPYVPAMRTGHTSLSKRPYVPAMRSGHASLPCVLGVTRSTHHPPRVRRARGCALRLAHRYHDGLPYTGIEPTPQGGCLLACNATGCLAPPMVQVFDLIDDAEVRAPACVRSASVVGCLSHRAFTPCRAQAVRWPCVVDRSGTTSPRRTPRLSRRCWTSSIVITAASLSILSFTSFPWRRSARISTQQAF